MIKFGFVGIDGCGKTTIFKLFTDGKLSNPPNPNVGIAPLPDDRIDFLVSVFKPQKTTYGQIEFIDPKGFTKASLAHLVPCDILIYVIPFFGEYTQPQNYLNKLEEEIILRDAELCKIAKDELLQKCKDILDKVMPLRKITFDEKEQRLLIGYGFLSQKPVIVILNTPYIESKSKEIEEFMSYAKAIGFNYNMVLDAKFELELKELSPDERNEFGTYEPALKRFIKIIRANDNAIFNYITFFTVVRDEVRAWLIKKGTTAYEGAGKIHSDIQRGFIKAEVIKFNDFVANPSIKDKGLIHIVDRNYIIEDADIIEFKFHI